MSQKIVIESSNPKDSPADIEDKLEKALRAVKLQRESKQFSDVYLKQRKDSADEVMKKVFENMVKDIADVLQ